MKNNTFNDLLKAAEQGDAEAQFNVSVAYRLGKGVDLHRFVILNC